MGSTVRRAFKKVSAVEAGKSGGRSNAPVKFEILNTFTPEDPLAGGVKMSKERTPIGIESTQLGSDGHNISPRKTIIPRFKPPS
jgi:hypothetical protein